MGQYTGDSATAKALQDAEAERKVVATTAAQEGGAQPVESKSSGQCKKDEDIPHVVGPSDPCKKQCIREGS